MNARLIAGHGAVAGLFTAAWEVAIRFPQAAPDPLLVVAGLVGPAAFAGLSLALIAAGGGTERREVHSQVDPAYLPAQTRRAVPPAARKELAR